ncbi:class I SAM-dependent methyltransferase [Bremerella alba]|uniref:Ubiquinone/menaquinone biosynthesis C-methyltransferase UbiE n=1 Tax=Bremerella alba TaxID=980252 RepID=A0A7V8V2P7_9BACT|nr:class I SAM-dependent methyltransferase [Bremerella alba]MBA2113776.1 Ubiquinone/menaquinone biosynthesis C-methyltransferase UbiE [Bremerella alba]
MSIRDAYSQWSITYDQDINRTRDLDQVATQQLLGNSRYQHTIEIGCGTGKNTSFYLSISETVTAVDFSPGMLDLARLKVESPSVVFREANLRERWPGADLAADLVACNLVLEHMDEMLPVFSESSRCLAAGGEFFVSELHPYRQYLGSQAQYQREGEVTFIDAYVHHFSEFHSAARSSGFQLNDVQEWWDDDLKERVPPRLITFLWKKVC